MGKCCHLLSDTQNSGKVDFWKRRETRGGIQCAKNYYSIFYALISSKPVISFLNFVRNYSTEPEIGVWHIWHSMNLSNKIGNVLASVQWRQEKYKQCAASKIRLHSFIVERCRLWK